MRSILTNTLLVALAGIGLAACASDVGDSSAPLRSVDEAALTGQLLYLAPDLSPYPMTIVDLDANGVDENEAIPVRVEVFDDLAVAWFAPEGAARVTRDGMMAVWAVEHRTPTSGELDNNAEFGTVEPTGEPIYFDRAREGVEVEIPESELIQTDVSTDIRGELILNFRDLIPIDSLGVARQIGSYHPGCL